MIPAEQLIPLVAVFGGFHGFGVDFAWQSSGG